MGWVALARDRGLQGSEQRPSRRRLLLWVLLAGAGMGAGTSALAAGGARPASFAALDRDRRGMINLDQAKNAAGLLFDQLDRHRTGKLPHAQFGRHRLTVAEFNWADRNHDGALTRDEYLALVERQFAAADLDHKGGVSRTEFESRTGLPLRRLLY